MISLLPGKILKLLEFVGFSGNKVSTYKLVLVNKWDSVCLKTDILLILNIDYILNIKRNIILISVDISLFR